MTAPSSRTATTSDRLVAITAGEPAGIGPDLCALVARERFAGRLVLVGDPRVIAERARARGFTLELPAYRNRASAPAVSMLAIPADAPVVAGRLDAANGRHVLALIDRALEGCRSGEFDAMVTAPVQKSTINEAGLPFTGHTEYLAQRTGTPRVVMMLVGGGLRVALATTHLPLAEVPRATRLAAVGSEPGGSTLYSRPGPSNSMLGPKFFITMPNRRPFHPVAYCTPKSNARPDAVTSRMFSFT